MGWRIVAFTMLVGSALGQATRPSPSFLGQWQTTYGPMTLTQNGDEISGVYGASVRATLTGKLDNGRLVFAYKEPSAAGEGSFTLAEDGRTFTGQWRENGKAQWAPWSGRRAAPPRPAGPFTGLWKTTYGRMRLFPDGNAVRGVYDSGGLSTLVGSVEDRTLTLSYTQPDGETGTAVFTLAEDHKSFSGKWKGKKQQVEAGGDWTGQRIEPVPGRQWLVVLEAHWESNLEEEEYSYGQMLRAFFTRVPSVKVRHRFFSSEADFRKWGTEVAFLAEPVVFYVSSHGTAEGIKCGDKTIDAAVLADVLKNAGDIRLLHFGSCLISSGPIPQKLQELLGDRATFPISGFVNVADWAGSAVVDFTYLDLVFSRGVQPVDAVKQVRRMISFAAEKGGGVIAPCGLVIRDAR